MAAHASSLVYLISGANRGLGLGLVKELLKRDNAVVFAGARNPSAAPELTELVEKHPGKVHVIKLTSADVEDNKAAAAHIQSVAGRLDVVIANAGVMQYVGPSLEASVESVQEHFTVNAVGTLVLFQATYPLLKASTPAPKFVSIGSRSGSISQGADLPLPVMPYGISKAAQLYITRKLRHEHEGLVCFALDPGAVATDLATHSTNGSTVTSHMQLQFKTVEEIAPQLLQRIDEATRDTDAFVRYDGTITGW